MSQIQWVRNLSKTRLGDVFDPWGVSCGRSAGGWTGLEHPRWCHSCLASWLGLNLCSTVVVVFKHSCKFFDTSPIKVSDLCSFMYVSLLNGGRSDIM